MLMPVMFTESPSAAFDEVTGRARSPTLSAAAASVEVALVENPNRAGLIFGEYLNTC
jgi:hypothetical protein